MAVGFAPVPVEEPVGEACAEVSLRFGSSAGRDACRPEAVMAAIDALAGLGAEVRLAGTDAHPTVEASFQGRHACVRAAEAMLVSDHNVRAATGNRIIVSGAVSAGYLVPEMPGVTRRVDLLAAGRLAERAAPGQILLGGSAWERELRVDSLPARMSESAPVSVLRGLR